MTAPQAKVRRDGQVASIPASGIVVGDILTLEAGDLVAADARLIKAAFLRCIESALTGESESVAMEFLFARNASGVHAWELDEALDPGRLDTKRYFDLLDRAMRTVLDPFKAGLPSLAMGRLL